ncbi:MAG: hypothetical protein OEZ02_00380 [Anaerolineae bacterium]|nr:hypothetical protein [Anaerolineae bacterium]
MISPNKQPNQENEFDILLARSLKNWANVNAPSARVRQELLDTAAKQPRSSGRDYYRLFEVASLWLLAQLRDYLVWLFEGDVVPSSHGWGSGEASYSLMLFFYGNRITST